MTRVTELGAAKVTAPQPGTTVLVELDAAYIPFALLGLEKFRLPFHWATDDDAARGRLAITTMQEALLMGITSELTDAVNRVYMAVRQLSVGEEFQSSGDGFPPDIPIVPPPLSNAVITGLLGQVYELRGQNPGGWFGIGAAPTTLADIASAMRAGSGDDIDRVTTALDTLVGASSGATIFNTVRGLLTDTASLGEQGGILAVLIASTMANVATAGLQAAQLDALTVNVARLVEQLGVALAPAPGDTVAGELASIRDLLTP